MATSPAFLLDTCASIWIAEDAPLARPALDALNEAAATRRSVMVSPMTGWEVGLLVARGRLRVATTPEHWYHRLIALPGLAETILSADILIRSSLLPGTPPRDPADRILAATARELGVPLMTRDRLLLTYADEGHIAAIEC